MKQPLPMDEYVVLGQELEFFRHAYYRKCGEIVDRFAGFRDRLRRLGLATTDGAAVPLQQHVESISSPNAAKIQAGDHWGTQVASLASSVISACQTESRDRKLLDIDPLAVSPTLRQLASQRVNMTTIQSGLWDQTIRCLETDACQAAYVMGWAFAYDVIRWWAWDKLRWPFVVKELQAKNKPVPSDYDDFFHVTLSEWDFLQACRDAGIFKPKPDKLHDRLKECLRERNDYAHANNQVATRESANAYIQKLIAILRDQPFLRFVQ